MLIIIIILLLILILAYQPSREFLFGIFALGSTLAIMIVIGAVVLVRKPKQTNPIAAEDGGGT